MSWTRCSLGHTHWGPRGAAGLLLVRDATVLLQLRADWAHHGGTWSTPGGAIDPGESAVSAALREAREELGLDSGAVLVRDSRVARCGGWPYETVLAHAQPDEEGMVRTHDLAESQAHRWVPLVEVDRLPLHPAFRVAWDHPDRALRDFVRASAEPGSAPRP